MPKGRDGEPRWPDGYVGSLTHCADVAMALMAERVRFASVGVDVETLSNPPGRLIERIATPDERDQLTQLGRTEPQIPWGLVVFSAKESVYKCHFQATGDQVSFSEISVRLHADGSLLVRSPVSRHEPRTSDHTRMLGAWAVTATHLGTAVWRNGQERCSRPE